MQANDLLIVLFFFLTAVTTKTRSQRVFSSLQTCVWWTSINRYHGFSRFGLEKILSPFLELSEEYVGVSALSAVFCCRI